MLFAACRAKESDCEPTCMPKTRSQSSLESIQNPPIRLRRQAAKQNETYGATIETFRRREADTPPGIVTRQPSQRKAPKMLDGFLVTMRANKGDLIAKSPNSLVASMVRLERRLQSSKYSTDRQPTVDVVGEGTANRRTLPKVLETILYSIDSTKFPVFRLEASKPFDRSGL